MFRKLLEFLGFRKPAVNLPCDPCSEGCTQPEDCFKDDSAGPEIWYNEIRTPAILTEFYQQDVPPPPLTPVAAPKQLTVQKPVKVKKPPVEKKEKKEKKTKAAAPVITAPKKKKTPAKKK